MFAFAKRTLSFGNPYFYRFFQAPPCPEQNLCDTLRQQKTPRHQHFWWNIWASGMMTCWVDPGLKRCWEFIHAADVIIGKWQVLWPFFLSRERYKDGRFFAPCREYTFIPTASTHTQLYRSDAKAFCLQHSHFCFDFYYQPNQIPTFAVSYAWCKRGSTTPWC